MDHMGGNDGMGYADQLLMNQPPQIFGAYTSDGSPIPPVLTDSMFGDLHDGSADDANDAKRRRIARVSAIHTPRHVHASYWMY